MSGAKTSGDRRGEMETRISNLAHEPLQDGHALGASDREMGHGVMVGTDQPTIGGGRAMSGQQCIGESMQPLAISRPERQDAIRRTTLLAESWRTID